MDPRRGGPGGGGEREGGSREGEKWRGVLLGGRKGWGMVGSRHDALSMSAHFYNIISVKLGRLIAILIIDV